MRSRASRRSRAAMMALVAVIAGAWFVYDAGRVVIDELRLRGDARTAEAVVVSKSQSLYARGRWYRRLQNLILSGHTTTFITYRFRLPDGAEVNNETPVSAATWDGLAEGASVPVRYAVAQPAINRPEGQGGLVLALFRLCLGIVLAGFGWAGWRARRPAGDGPADA